MTVAKNPDNHVKAVSVPGTAPTCSEPGLTDGSKCSGCGAVLTAQETIPATGEHIDKNNDGRCDGCNMCKWCGKVHSVDFWQRITEFFHRIFIVIFGAKY